MASKPMEPSKFAALEDYENVYATVREMNEAYSALHALFAKYGQHLPECGVGSVIINTIVVTIKCTCGFEEVKV